MNENAAIEVNDLTKSYGAVRVLDGIDLRVPAGTVFALLGPNGAGKTTTVRILATLVAPDGGSARVAGHDVIADRHAIRRRISLTGQYAAIDELQTGRENLEMMGRLRRLRRRAARARATELLERFDLAEAGDRRVVELLGRHATAPGPRGRPGREPRGDLPRRAYDRARPARASGHVAGRDRPDRGRRHGAPDHAVPRRGRAARRHHRGARPGPDRGRGERPGAEAAGRRRPARPTAGRRVEFRRVERLPRRAGRAR